MATQQKKIKALQDTVAQLKAEKAALQQRLLDAEGELLTAEREQRRTKKLTTAQSRVLVEMSRGAEIHRNPFYPYRYFLKNKFNGYHLEDVRDSIFYGLKEREVIEENAAHVSRINDHGKSIVAALSGSSEQPSIDCISE